MASELRCSVALIVVAAFSAPRAARSAPDDKARVPVPEPLIWETAADIDGDEPGELEVDATTALRRSSDHGTSWSGELSLEGRLTARMGAEIELSGARVLTGGTGSSGALDGRATTSLGVARDRARDFYVQLEASARLSLVGRDDAFDAPGDPALPYAVGARWAVRRGRIALRGGVDVELGGHGARAVPVAADAELLATWGTPRAQSFAGVELATDLAAADPVVVAPEIAFAVARGSIPMRLGVAVPAVMSVGLGAASVSVLVRLVVEIED